MRPSGRLMQIHVQVFSILRDCLPPGTERGRAVVVLPEGMTLAGLVEHLGIDRFLGCETGEIVARAGWQVLISGSYEPNMDRALHDGDEVMILPFVSGGQ